MPSDTTTIQDKVARLPHREAERRLKAYDEGATDARDIDDALSEIEQRLK